MPEVGIYDSPEVNAFATGPSKSRSLVAVSSGLLRSMRRDEVEGVLAHEVAHIANGDMVTMTLLQGIVNAFVMFLARIIAYALTNRGSRDDQGAAPSFMLVMDARARARRPRHDRGGLVLAPARVPRRPRRRHAGRQGRACWRPCAGSAPIARLIDPRHEALATMKISGKWTGLFSTHPPLEQRIAALERAQIS